MWIDNESFFHTASTNDIVLFGDGEIACFVNSCSANKVVLRVENSGVITNGTSLNIKGKTVNHFYISEHELTAIKNILIDFPISIVLSFVESKDNIEWAKKEFVGAHEIVPKIETLQSLQNLEEIINSTHMLFIGRGDLSLAVGIEKIGIIQRRIITVSHQFGCKVCVGTGVLDSLRWSETPLRSEIIDITNSFLENVDIIVLTSETGGANDPFKAIRYLNLVIDYLKSLDS